MQENIPTSPTWLHAALGWLAAFLAGGGVWKLVDIWLNRKKPTAEVHVTEATATEITVRAGSTAGDAVIRMMDRLDEAQITIDKLRAERDGLKLKADLAVIEANSLTQQLERASGYLKAHGLHLSDLDKPKL